MATKLRHLGVNLTKDVVNNIKKLGKITNNFEEHRARFI